MRIEVVTLFPELVDGASRYGVTGRARERGLWALDTVNPRDYATAIEPSTTVHMAAGRAW
jgi:tRNA (guanine37-N1)-methyltransferase